MNSKQAGTWIAMALLAALAMSSAGCNGLLVVKRGPKAGELNWAGRSVAWTGWSAIGAEPVNLKQSYPAESEP